MTRLRKAGFALALVLLAALALQPLTAQTALFSTTLGAALSAPTPGSPNTLITLASGTNVAVGQGLVVDNEYMTIQSATATTTQWNVVRGQSGTYADAHANSASVLFGLPNNFYFDSRQPSGTCVSTLTQATPRVVVAPPKDGGVSIFLCPAVNTLAGSTVARWGQVTAEGAPYAGSMLQPTGWTYTTAGALTIQPGVQLIGSGGALAMTLAAPSTYMDGLTMVLRASTAQAHTVTLGTGNWGIIATTIATFGGAIGDGLTIYAQGGTWRVLTVRNVTFS